MLSTGGLEFIYTLLPRMLVEITQAKPFHPNGLSVSLQHLSITKHSLSFTLEVVPQHDISDSSFSLVLTSGLLSLDWPLRLTSDLTPVLLEGEAATHHLHPEVSLSLCIDSLLTPWLKLSLDPSIVNDLNHWKSFFLGNLSTFPFANPSLVSSKALKSATCFAASNPPSKYTRFCKLLSQPDFVVSLAKLCRNGYFPGIFSEKHCLLFASKLVLNWNILLLHDADQRILVFQGVTSCDAVYIPGFNELIINCHITSDQISQCIQVLVRTPEFFAISNPRDFTGFLVGHSRPYHCNYDSLLALQRVREASQLYPQDFLFSKSDEAFIDLSDGLGLSQEHQIRSKEDLNELIEHQKGFLLHLGSLFFRHGKIPDISALEIANRVDKSLRQYANSSSVLSSSGALDFFDDCEPLLWVGITGQKRRWLQQVEGTASILNRLYQSYPKLGVVFDGWTPPLTSSKYHRREARKDDNVIRQIIKRLHFRSQGRFGILAGLPMLEKIRVGMSVDLFLANYTTGSLNVARICQKPGLGHMSLRMADSRDQHIHHRTREIDPVFVADLVEPDTPTGYTNYSVPWQAMYNCLIDILEELPIEAASPPQRLAVPEPDRPCDQI